MNHEFGRLGKKQAQKGRGHNHKVDIMKRFVLIVLSISIIILTNTGFVHAQPLAQTLPASNVTDTFAVLTGNVFPGGVDTAWYFVYGPQASVVGTDCPPLPGGALPGSVYESPVACPVKDLQPSTTYDFYLRALWPDGTHRDGDTLSFTTSSPLATMTGIVTVIPKSTTSTTSTTSQPKGPAFDFALSVSPSTVSVQQGQTAHYAVGVTYSDPSYYGTLINLQLTGLGPGMGWSVTPAGDLAITTLASTPTGSYTLSLTGSANGVARQTGVILMVATAQPVTTAVTTPTPMTTTASSSTAVSSVPFDYSVTVSPSTQSAQKGGSVSYVVSVLPLSGSPVPVSLSLMGCPADVRTGFTTQSANPPYTSTLNLDLSSSSANAGAYTLTILASAGGNVKTATATLMIQEKPAQTIVAPTTATSGTNWSDFLSSQQNQLLLLLLLLAVVLGVLGFKFGRRDRKVPSTISTPGGFCGSCGAVMGEGNQFCPKCGAKRPVS